MLSIREELEAAERLALGSFAVCSVNSRGRAHREEPCAVRTCFQRDVDRIIHSKAFRRLKHKTQVFLQPEGDHYRTRLTHTLEVSRIARTIARSLRLNEDLTEAAALGHDLGHTPFGHAGEQALGEIFAEGFEHNVQSLRVVDKLEKNGKGLNLTHEVRMGILCHTGGKAAETLEGGIIRIADRIAYINHDIDDAVRAGVLDNSDIPAHLVAMLGDSHRERINTLTLDVIKRSVGKDTLNMSDEVERAMLQLRDFMFENVYRNPIAKGEESKARDILKRLFEYYVRNPDKMPADYREYIEAESVERAVCDYIAGMTDQYAISAYSGIFIPFGWSK